MKKIFLFLTISSLFVYSCSLLNAPKEDEKTAAVTPKDIVGKLKSRTIYPTLESQTAIDEWGYEYDSTGRLKQQTRYDVNTFPKRVLSYITYKYDSANLVQSTQLFSRNINAPAGFVVTEESTFRYSKDSLRLLTERIVTNRQNNTAGTFRFTYNGKRLVRMTNPALNPPGYVTYEYNADGNRTRENRYSSLNLVYQYTTFTYSSSDTLLARSTLYEPDNTARTITTYQYNQEKKRTLEDIRQQKLATNQSNFVVRYSYYE
jgi:YD repeat-containing protein